MGTVKINLLGSVSSGRIFYAEAEKGFVDRLLALLALPTGALFNLLRQKSDGEIISTAVTAEGHSFTPCIANIYDSVDGIDDMALDCCKSDLLTPQVAHGSRQPLLGYVDATGGSLRDGSKNDSTGQVWYRCLHENAMGESQYGSCLYMSSSPSFQCPEHGSVNSYSTQQMTIVNSAPQNVPAAVNMGRKSVPQRGGYTAPQNVAAAPTVGPGYVKVNVTFMVTDDLQVFRSSTIRSIQILNEMKVTNMGDLEGVEVEVGKEEVLKIVKCALTRENGVLTEIFGKRFLAAVSGKKQRAG